LRLGGTGLAGALLLGSARARVLAQTRTSLRSEFETAAAKYKVPKELLMAMGYVNTLWEMPPPGASDYVPGDIHGRGTYGIMQLLQNPTRDTLGRAASLTGFSEQELKSSRAAIVRGGAAVLAHIQGENRPAGLNGWQEAVAEYGDTDLYAVEVYETLKNGASATISTGEHLEAGLPWQLHQRQPGAAKIDSIVIRVAQGSYSGTMNWFQDPRANVSAHYVVSRRGKGALCTPVTNMSSS
jgi:hypothetical protein